MTATAAETADAERPPWVLGIDIGTSSTKAILFDALGAAVPSVRVQISYSANSAAAGASEFAADELVAHVAEAVDQVLSLAGHRRQQIAAAGCCSFWHSMVGVDAAGATVSPVYTWADTRPGPSAAALAATVDESVYRRRTGCPLHSSYFPARLAWLAAARPDELHLASQWISPAEFLYYRLFGRPSISVCMASATGLFDQDRCDWDDEALELAGIDQDCLPALDPDDAPLSGLTAEWAARWPELATIPWARPIGDGAAGNVGSACLTPERAAINLGTSGAIRIATRGPVPAVPHGLWRYRIDRDRALVGGAFSDGGNMADWCDKVLAAGGEERASHDSHGLTVLPFLAGERSLGWRPGATATIHGLSLHTTPSDIRQAFREAVALRFAAVADLLRGCFSGISEAILSGGAPARSPAWRQLLADALGMPVRGVAEPETTCRGAALVALRKAGLIASEDLAVGVAEGEAAAPNTEGHAALVAALERQQRLYERMVPPL